MIGGYAGKLLRVDLSRNEMWDEELEEAELKKYLGGSGLAAKILFEETTPHTGPLTPENRLIFMTGPMTDTAVPTSSRYSVVALSPKTGIWGESNCSGFWGPELKEAGYDGIIFQGKAPSPVYIWIDKGTVEIRDASHLWGKDTFQTDEMIKSETHPQAHVACIGPAGERLVHIACIATGGKHTRVAGRTGMGAVMGSKNIKAIAVHGNGKVPVVDSRSLRDSVKEIMPEMKQRGQKMAANGTANSIPVYEQLGNLPIKNWRQGSWPEGAQKICGEQMTRTILTGSYRCKGCPVGCGREVKIGEGKFAGVEGAGPEYETLALLGSLCLIDDLEAVAKANELCNRYGIDTMSTGAAIAFAMEAYEKGLLTKEALDGVELEWGDADAMIAMVEKIAKREGFGEFLGMGVREAAEKLGPRAQEFALQVKGLEIPGHDPRAFHSVGVSYATSNRGGCHLAGETHWVEIGTVFPELGWDKPFDRFATEGKGEVVAKMQDLMSLYDALGVCKFSALFGMRPIHLLEWLNNITGWNFDLKELMKTAERSYNLRRLYNVRLGISRKDDTLPMRFLSQRRGEGGAAKALPHLGAMLSDYYEYRGWSDEGIPTPEKLAELGLSDFAVS